MPLLALLGLLAAPPALAADAKVALVGVHEAGLDIREERQILDDLVRMLDATEGWDPLAPIEVLRALDGRQDLVLEAGYLSRGRALFDDGRLLYLQAQPEAAVEVLEQAVDELERGALVGGTVRDLWGAWMLLGTAAWSAGDEARAREAFQSAVAFNPERRPDLADYPPDVIAFYEEERDISLDESAKVTITVDGRNATVDVDGLIRGPSPLVIERLPPGDHVLWARNELGERATRALELRPVDERRIELYLDAPILAPGEVTPAGRARQTSALYTALGEQARVDHVLLLGIDGIDVVAQLFNTASRSFSAPVRVRLDQGAPYIEAVRRLVGAESRERAASAEPLALEASHVLAELLLSPERMVVATTGRAARDDPPTRVRSTEARERKPIPWWAWAAGGGAAVAIAGGVTAAVLASRPGPDPTPIPGGIIRIGPVTE